MKRLFILLFAMGCLSICLAQDAHFYLKDGVQLSWDLSTIDSITYVKPEAEVVLPASCTIKKGSKAKFSYIVSDGIATESINLLSTNSNVAYVNNDTLYALGIGKCLVHTTYKGVTSTCVVTVEPVLEMEQLASLTSYAALATYSSAEIGVYLSQALTTTGNAQTTLYPYRNGWNLSYDIHPYMTWYSRDMMPACLSLLADAQTKGYKNVSLIARTIRLMTTMLATDIYGDLPKAQIDMFIAPKYESQQDIYTWMFKEADELLAAYSSTDWLNCPTNLKIDAQLDPIYGGDLTKWASFCKALKARLWLRKLPNWDNTSTTCNTIIAMVNEALTNWQEPRYQYAATAYENTCPWGPNTPWYSPLWGNGLHSSLPSTFFLHGIMGSIDGAYQRTRGYALDPRASRIMQQNIPSPMLHLENNIGMDIFYTTSDYPYLYSSYNPYTQNNGYIALLTTEELLFIKAEAQYWAGDVAGAYTTTVSATKHNMQRYGLEESTIASNSDLQNQYNRFFEIKLPGAGQFTIADLMQQKYVAMYLQPEQWTDMRRYNYSSSANGISYVAPGKAPVYVYDVKRVHNGRNTLFANDASNFCLTYSLHRPYNLYEPYWCTADNYGTNAQLSPNAWVMRINQPSPQFALPELIRLGIYTAGADRPELNPLFLKKRMIWAQKNEQVVQTLDNIPWL